MAVFSYFEHDADIGIAGSGITVEAAFEAAAEALFSIQSDLAEIRPVTEIGVEFTEDDIEYALVTWLNRLVFEAQSRKLALCRFELHRDGNIWRGKALGEPWRDSMTRGVEVKGATLTMLGVKHVGDLWTARCIVDV